MAKKVKSSRKDNTPKPPTLTNLWAERWPELRWVDSVLVALCFFVLYAITSSPTVTMEDSGEFITTAMGWSIPHPPGYPLVTSLSYLFTLLPLPVSVAYKVHLYNALMGASAVGFSVAAFYLLSGNRFIALASACLFGTSRTLWSQSIIAEVYSTHILLFVLLFVLTIRTLVAPNARHFILWGFFYGLGLTNSWPLLIMGSGTFLFLFLPSIRELSRHLHWLMIGVAIGFSFYFLLFVMGAEPGAINFIDRVHNWDDLRAYVARKEYDSNSEVFYFWTDKLRFFWTFCTYAWQDFGWLAGSCLPLAVWFLFRHVQGCLRWSLLAAILSTSVILYWLWQIEYSRLTTQVALVFHLMAFWALSYLVVASVANLLAKILKEQKLQYSLLAVLVASNLGFQWPANNMSKDTFAGDFARLMLETLPPNSIFILWGDADTGPVTYMRFAEKVRPDVTVTSQMGVLFPEQMFDRVHVKDNRTRALSMQTYITNKLNQGVRVFSTRRLIFHDLMNSPAFSYTSHGLYDELTLKVLPPSVNPEVVSGARKILDRLPVGDYKEHWIYHRNIIIRRLCKSIVEAGETHSLMSSNFDCQMARVAYDYEVTKNYAQAAEIMRPLLYVNIDAPSKDRADFLRLYVIIKTKALSAQKLPGTEVIAQLQELVNEMLPFARQFPSCDNSMVISLLEILSQVSLQVDKDFLRQTFARCPQAAPFLVKLR